MYVALLAEGVDRNLLPFLAAITDTVALLAEGVDRNCISTDKIPHLLRSPSSRRAWIEIRRQPQPRDRCIVALLAEGVDRNLGFHTYLTQTGKVALLAEGVDRNRIANTV